MKTLLILILACAPCLAGTVIFDGAVLEYDDEYSLKRFGGGDLKNKTGMSYRKIYAADFSRETLTDIFPQGMHDVHFYNCGLCNVVIPPGNFVHDFNHESGCPAPEEVEP